MSFTEQFSAATASAKSQLESQLDVANHYASTAFSGVQQMIALNFNTTRASVERSSAVAKQLLEAKDPRDLIVPTPPLDTLLSYSRELYSIASKTQADLLQLVKDQFKDATANAAAAAAKPLALAGKIATQPAAAIFAAVPVAASVVVAPVSDEPAEAEVAEAPVAAPKAAKAEAKPEVKAKPAAPAAAQPKPVAETVAELVSNAAEDKLAAADVQEAKPVVLKSVSPKK